MSERKATRNFISNIACGLRSFDWMLKTPYLLYLWSWWQSPIRFHRTPRGNRWVCTVSICGPQWGTVGSPLGTQEGLVIVQEFHLHQERISLPPHPTNITYQHYPTRMPLKWTNKRGGLVSGARVVTLSSTGCRKRRPMLANGLISSVVFGVGGHVYVTLHAFVNCWMVDGEVEMYWAVRFVSTIQRTRTTEIRRCKKFCTRCRNTAINPTVERLIYSVTVNN